MDEVTRSPTEEQRLADVKRRGMEASVRELEEDPPLCACCQTATPSPISDESEPWTHRPFALGSVSVDLTLCPDCSAPSPTPREVREPVARDALKALGCTCDPIIAIDGNDLATGHDSACSLLRHQQGV